MSDNRVYQLYAGSGLTLTAAGTIVVSPDMVCLVDPASIKTIAELESLLEPLPVKAKDVDTIFYTHLHFDHFSLSEVNELAGRIYMPEKEVAYIRSLMAFKDDEVAYERYLVESHDFIAPIFVRQFLRYRFDERYDMDTVLKRYPITLISGEVELRSGVKTVPLPGHCAGQLGLLVTEKSKLERAKTVMIAGDAVLSEDDWRMADISNHFIIYDCIEWHLTRIKLNQVDEIIPGHGRRFSVEAEVLI